MTERKMVKKIICKRDLGRSWGVAQSGPKEESDCNHPKTLADKDTDKTGMKTKRPHKEKSVRMATSKICI